MFAPLQNSVLVSSVALKGLISLALCGELTSLNLQGCCSHVRTCRLLDSSRSLARPLRRELRGRLRSEESLQEHLGHSDRWRWL